MGVVKEKHLEDVTLLALGERQQKALEQEIINVRII
jgi:hypothetical protein